MINTYDIPFLQTQILSHAEIFWHLRITYAYKIKTKWA